MIDSGLHVCQCDVSEQWRPDAVCKKEAGEPWVMSVADAAEYIEHFFLERFGKHNVCPFLHTTVLPYHAELYRKPAPDVDGGGIADDYRRAGRLRKRLTNRAMRGIIKPNSSRAQEMPILRPRKTTAPPNCHLDAVFLFVYMNGQKIASPTVSLTLQPEKIILLQFP